jgi:hypothetical protein
MTTVLWPIYFSEYLVRVRANVFELGCGILLPRLEVGMMAFIVVEFNEPLIGVMYLVSLQPDPRDGLVNRCLLSVLLCTGAVPERGCSLC